MSFATMVKRVVKDSIGSCTGCSLDRVNFVPFDIPPDVQVVIVGEAPGANEVTEKCPFVGKSGQQLRQIVASVGLPQTQVGYANVVSCRPPANATPDKKIIQLCGKRNLLPKLKALNPKLVVVVGYSAFQFFFPGSKKAKADKRFREWCGNFKSIKGLPFKVLTTFHPARILYGGGSNATEGRTMYKVIHRDLEKAKAYLDGTLFADRDYHVVESIEDIDKWTDFLLKQPLLSADIETTGLQAFLPTAAVQMVSFGYGPRKSAVCFPIDHKEVKDVQFKKHCQEAVRKLFAARPVLIGHNIAKFDLVYLWGLHYIDSETLVKLVREKSIVDTMFLAYLEREDQRSYSLKHVVGKLLEGYSDIVDDFMNTSLEEMTLYNNEDADKNRRLMKPMIRRRNRFEEIWTSEKENPKVHSLKWLHDEVMVPAGVAFGIMEESGICVDLQAVEDLKVELQAETKQLIDKINKEHMPKGRTCTSNYDLAWLLYEKKGYPVAATTPKGHSSVDKHALNDLVRGHKCQIAEDMIAIRTNGKLLSSYLEPYPHLVASDGKIHADFFLISTVTGRASSANPNLQQIPRDIRMRRLFVASPGNVFIASDFSQAELRVGCSLANERTMIQAYLDGKDLHKVTGAMIANVLYDEVDKATRQNAKPTNFSLLFGAQWQKLQEIAKREYKIILSNKEAQHYRKVFFDTYSDFPAWYGKVTTQLIRNGLVRSEFGRIRHLPNIYSSDEVKRAEAKRMGINFVVQALSSSMNLMVFAHCQLEFVRRGMKARAVSTVHDSILIDTPPGEVDEVVALLREAMTKLDFDWLKVPMVLDIEKGERWKDGMVTIAA